MHIRKQNTSFGYIYAPTGTECMRRNVLSSVSLFGCSSGSDSSHVISRMRKKEDNVVGQTVGAIDIINVGGRPIIKHKSIDICKCSEL